MKSLLTILLILAVARLGLWAAGLLHRRLAVQPETSRKLLHAFLGLMLCACPWLFADLWPVLLLSAIFLALLLARPRVRLLNPPAAQLIFVAGRRGEFFYPVALAVLFALARGRPLLFCIPMLILALADSAAALMGSRYGPRRGPCHGPAKSLEGSAAFALTAFLASHVTLLLTTDLPRVTTLLVALNLAAALAGVEALCAGGWDNLLLPLGGFVLLRVMLAMNPATLAAVCGLSAVGLILVWLRWPCFLALARLSALGRAAPT